MNELVKLIAKLFGKIAGAVGVVFSYIWKKYSGYCQKHNYNPRRMLCTIIAVLLIVVGISVAEELIERYNAGKSGMGLENIGELATQSYHYRTVDVLKKSQEIWGWDVPLTKAESIFSYEGVIKAGYDFEDIEVDVDYNDKIITVRLPEAGILSNEILPDSLNVYSEDTNIFTPLKVADFNDKQQEMKEQGETDAVNTGIYEAARKNAELLITGFLSGAFDLNEYTLVFE